MVWSASRPMLMGRCKGYIRVYRGGMGLDASGIGTRYTFDFCAPCFAMRLRSPWTSDERSEKFSSSFASASSMSCRAQLKMCTLRAESRKRQYEVLYSRSTQTTRTGSSGQNMGSTFIFGTYDFLAFSAISCASSASRSASSLSSSSRLTM